MIKGKIVTSDENHPFTIDFNNGNKIINAEEKVREYFEEIDDYIDTRPAGDLLEVKFDEASEEDLALYFLLKPEYNLDSYPDDINLMDPGPADEDILV